MSGRRAFTLVEMLMAIAIMALAATVVAVGLGAARNGAEERECLSRLKALERRARLAAQTIGPATLRLAPDGASVELTVDSGADPEPIGTVSAPGGRSIALEDGDGHPVDAVAYGRSSRCIDHRFGLAGSGRRFAVSGLTGLVREVPE